MCTMLCIAMVGITAGLAAPPPVAAQDALSTASQAYSLADSTSITPGGAFLRSVLVPGWGHVASDSYGRAGFYVTAQAGSLWMLWQSLSRRSQAAAFERVEREVVEERLLSQGTASPDSIQMIVDGDPEVAHWMALVEARDQQVEDWSALSIFLVLLGAADAFVAAHLSDFPEPLALDVIPLGDRTIEARVSFPLRLTLGRPRR